MSFLGSFLGPVTSIVGGVMQNKAAESAADENRNWQTYMSNTAHQREVADLRAAGLNPILSATGGNGASTPSGATAQTTNIAGTAGSDFVSAQRLKDVEKKSVENSIRMTDSNVKLNDANAAKAAEEVKTQVSTQGLNSALASKAAADTATSLAQAKFIAASTDESLARTDETRSRIPINERMLSQMDANIQLALAQAALAGTSSALNLAHVSKIGAEIPFIGAQTDKTKIDTQKSWQESQNLEQYRDINRNRQNYENNSSLAPYLPYAGRIIDTFSPFK